MTSQFIPFERDNISSKMIHSDFGEITFDNDDGVLSIYGNIQIDIENIEEREQYLKTLKEIQKVISASIFILENNNE